ncbi:MAG: hypothetical protein LKJ47_04840 [Bifidobacteriaceae bacterium]|jgi:hypothetical protein|nr:hypothetical protein [Bifidobacteriaceae bacterium]
MATDAQALEAYRQLRPYYSGLDSAELASLDDGIEAGEPQLALSWLIAATNEPGVSVPQSELLDAFALLSDDDKEEYRGLLDSPNVTKAA